MHPKRFVASPVETSHSVFSFFSLFRFLVGSVLLPVKNVRCRSTITPQNKFFQMDVFTCVLCICVFCLHVYKCTTFVPFVLGVKKKKLDPLELV